MMITELSIVKSTPTALPRIKPAPKKTLPSPSDVLAAAPMSITIVTSYTALRSTAPCSAVMSGYTRTFARYCPTATPRGFSVIENASVPLGFRLFAFAETSSHETAGSTTMLIGNAYASVFVTSTNREV